MPDSSIANGNVVNMALHHAHEHPDKIAIVVPTKWDEERVLEEQVYTYKELMERMQTFRAGLEAEGFEPGDRVILLFAVSADFFAMIMAILANGLTVVLIDTGMGTERIKSAMETANAKGIITMHALLKYRFVIKQLRRIPKKFSVDKAGWFVKHVDKLTACGATVAKALTRGPEDEALITFTSGSTGAPKGANRTHGFLMAQHKAFRASLPDFEGQIEIQSFPVVALHNLSCGASSVMPAVNLATPAAVNPKVLYDQITSWHVNSMGAAPAFMGRLGDYLKKENITIPTMIRCFTGGAPVSVDLCQTLLDSFPNVEGYAVYGSTEAEPMAKALFEDVIRLDGQGDGFLAGKVATVSEIVIVQFPEEPPKIGPEGVKPHIQPQGSLGEIIVRGDHVNRGYIDNPQANLENKVPEPDGSIWHRTGDVGYFDVNGMLWLTGRLKDAVSHYGKMIQPLPIEAELDGLPQIFRSAIVSSQRAPNGHIYVQLMEGQNPESVKNEILERLAARGMKAIDVEFVEKMAVDGRHNSKIDRPTLRAQLDKS